MKIAIDVSPVEDRGLMQHRVRGVGFYIDNLKKALVKYFPENQYYFFVRGQNLPKTIDLLHYPYFDPFFRTLPFFKKYKTVITVHDLTPLIFPKEFPAGIRGKAVWQVQRLALQKADAIITDSNSSKKDIIKYARVPAEKVWVVYLAAGEEFRKLEAGDWELEIKKRYALPDRFALYVGDATWNKNLPRLIQAIEQVGIPLVMVGRALVETNFDKTNPWNRDLVKVQEIASENKKIIRLGFIPTEDLVKIYNLATVFVMPSIYEGFGLPVLEAMACGCPVVAGNTSSLPEICDKATIMVDPYKTDDIARGIKEVLDNKLVRAALQKKGLAQAKKFSWKKTAKETIDVYRKVVEFSLYEKAL
jgi:glycosyltransferase involved in cell wall biosynthesis